MNKIFIACPISKYIKGHEFVNNDFRLFIEELYNICQSFVPEVFLALKREKYGKNLMPDTCTQLDYAEMINSDLIIAIPDDSKGTAVELGWASVLKKKIILILDNNERYTPLISGLNDITDTQIICYNNTLNSEVLFEVELLLKKQSEE